MQTIRIDRGLDLPLSGQPEQAIRAANSVRHVALVGEDTVGLKPTMLVKEGDRVRLGQPLFTDKKNKGIQFTAPGSGRVVALNRGAKRRFESLVIALDGDERELFFAPERRSVLDMDAEAIRQLLLTSGLWTAFRTRPFGKVPAAGATPASLFITAIDSAPLAPDPQCIISRSPECYHLGLEILQRLLPVPIYYCTGSEKLDPAEELSGLHYRRFVGPHPAGLPSTHIHFVDPVHADKTVWHLDYQDVLALGYLGQNGYLQTERIVALAGPGARRPSLVATRVGAALDELCGLDGRGAWELLERKDLRLISGSVLDGRLPGDTCRFLGRYHHQVSILEESAGRALLSCLRSGKERFSSKPIFTSALEKGKRFALGMARWGGRRALYPLGTYEQVMPLDIMATFLLKALLIGDTEKAQALGCLELVEEDLALCSFVCPGKNVYGERLREVLDGIERGE